MNCTTGSTFPFFLSPFVRGGGGGGGLGGIDSVGSSRFMFAEDREPFQDTQKKTPVVVGIRVSCSARDKPAVWDDRSGGVAYFPHVNRRTFLLYKIERLPHQDTQAIKHPFLSYLSIVGT